LAGSFTSRTDLGLALVALVVGSCAKPPPPSPSAEQIITQAKTVLAQPDPDGWQHRAAVDALSGLRDAKAIEPLAAVLDAEEGKYEFFLRRMAARALGRIADARAAGALAKGLTRTEGPLRLEEDCAAALSALGALAVPALTAQLDAEPDAAVASARVLGSIGDPAARAALEAAKDKAIGRPRRAIEDALAAGAEMWEKGAPDSGVKK